MEMISYKDYSYYDQERNGNITLNIIKKTKRVGGLFLILMLCSGFLAASVSAAESSVIDTGRKGSTTVKIWGVEFDPDTESYTPEHPFAGVEVTLYRVGDIVVENSVVTYRLTDDFLDGGVSLESVDSAEASGAAAKKLKNYAQLNQIAGVASAVSDEDGNAVFPDLSDGLYLVNPDVSTNDKIRSEIDPFLVSVPMTNELGTAWVYDVEAKPKTEPIYGGVILEKVNGSREYLQGAKFRLEIKNEDGSWSVYEEDLISDENGQLAATELRYGTYRFIETKAPADYGLSKEVKEFDISACGTIYIDAAGRYAVESGEIPVITFVNHKAEPTPTPTTSPKVNASRTSSPSRVKTGDTANMEILMWILISALVVISILLRQKNAEKC